MKKTIICCNGRFIVGGIETYYMRMFEWAYAKGYRNILIVEKNGKIDKSWFEPLRKLKVEIFLYNMADIMGGKLINRDGKKVFFQKDEDIIFISPTVSIYTMTLRAIKRYRLNAKSIFYIFDPVHARITRFNCIRFIYKNLVIKKMWNNGLVFMDEETLLYAVNCYHFKEYDKNSILRLGEFFREYDFSYNEDRLNNEDFIILSVCRMQFPFKAYILGLLKIFEEIEKDYPHIKLVIIGEGENEKELFDEWEKLDKSTRNKVSLLGKVDYYNLGNYFQKANLYIGMGTTLLDAAEYGVIGIVATSYQYEDFSFGFFKDNYCVLGGLKEEGGDKFHIKDLIKQVLEWDAEEYLEASLRTYTVAKDNYNIEIIMPKLLALDVKSLGKMRSLLLWIFDRVLFFPRIVAHLVQKDNINNLKKKEEIGNAN